MSIKATLAFAQDAVISQGIVRGFDYADPNATPLQVFKQPRNHLVAVASILQFQGYLNHFTPHSQVPAKSTKAFKAFEESLQTSPFWRRTATYVKWPKVKEGGLDDLRHALRSSLYEKEYHHQTANRLADMVPTTIPDADLKRWILSIVAIQRHMFPDDKITIGLAKLGLDLEVEDDGDDDNSGDCDVNSEDERLLQWIGKPKRGGNKKVRVPRQVADLDVSVYEVDRNVLIDNAESLAKQIKPVSLDRFIEFFTTRDQGAGDNAPTEWSNFISWDDKYEEILEGLPIFTRDRSHRRPFSH
ncbi:hypothetical protein BGW42_006865 [Actinomortierella wolfii]|nr:hypothetical protein BGW42_006865 [Actinomortierella wolfii]